jgi:hypothetical protein
MTLSESFDNTLTIQDTRAALQAFIAHYIANQPPPTTLRPAHRSTITIELASGKHLVVPSKSLPASTLATVPISHLPPLQTMTSSRCPKNKAESIVHKSLTSKGWLVSKRGWPDFFAINPKTGHLAVIEVKPSRGRQLKKHQRIVMHILAAFNIPCFLWNPDSGFSRVGLNTPATDHSECPQIQQQFEIKRGE